MTAASGYEALARGAVDTIELPAREGKPVMLALTSSQAQRLAGVLIEELERVEWYKKTTSRAHVSYHHMLEAIQSDVCDTYEQLSGILQLQAQPAGV